MHCVAFHRRCRCRRSASHSYSVMYTHLIRLFSIQRAAHGIVLRNSASAHTSATAAATRLRSTLHTPQIPFRYSAHVLHSRRRRHKITTEHVVCRPHTRKKPHSHSNLCPHSPTAPPPALPLRSRIVMHTVHAGCVCTFRALRTTWQGSWVWEGGCGSSGNSSSSALLRVCVHVHPTAECLFIFAHETLLEGERRWRGTARAVGVRGAKCSTWQSSEFVSALAGARTRTSCAPSPCSTSVCI